jgi:hypothetical protein
VHWEQAPAFHIWRKTSADLKEPATEKTVIKKEIINNQLQFIKIRSESVMLE